eukprot:10935812-Ditylum_brightwellii.AAC.1
MHIYGGWKIIHMEKYVKGVQICFTVDLHGGAISFAQSNGLAFLHEGLKLKSFLSPQMLVKDHMDQESDCKVQSYF